MARILCAYPKCKKTTAKYFMVWEDSQGQKHCGLVCARHDKILGRGHLMETGMTLEKAIDFERELKESEI